MLRLAVVCGGRTTHLEVPEGVASLGSGSHNMLVVSCAGVSSTHAEVVRQGASVTIRDCGSKNGILVNGRRIAEVTFERGTAVIIGRAVVRLEEIDTADAEIALPLDSNRGPQNQTMRRTETLAVGDDVVGEVLAWVRTFERDDSSAADAFDAVRRVVGASTLILLHGDDALRELAGPLPPQEAIRELSSPPAPRWLTTPARGDLRLCAYFGEGAPGGAWRGEFLAYAAEKFSDTPKPHRVKRAMGLVFTDDEVRSSSPAMREVYERVEQAVKSDLNVLILGESGTGKEVIARLIHASDRTRRGAYVAVNATAVPAEMLEAELFGVVRGAATNVAARDGAFRAANRGTVLLDEIGDMPLGLQAKLLRVVEAHVVTPLGASSPESLDVRILAATNLAEFEKRVEEGTFRRDLFYRLNGLAIHLPPLRARREDIAALATRFAQAAASRFEKHIKGISTKALARLETHSWPGNVRELKIVIERAVLECPNGAAIESSHITVAEVAAPATPVLLGEQKTAAERRAILAALEHAGGNRTHAARALGISRTALQKKLRLLGIT